MRERKINFHLSLRCSSANDWMLPLDAFLISVHKMERSFQLRVNFEQATQLPSS